MILNPSLEDVRGGKPLGWTLSGGRPRDLLQTGDAHTGERFIVLRPTGERLKWQTDLIAIKPRRKYGLTWWTRIDGSRPWHWTYLTRFTGVELEFSSAEGICLEIRSRRINCLRTRGWARAWIAFESPFRARGLRIAFILDSPAHIQMQMDVDDVNLEEIPSSPPNGKGRLRIWAFKDGDKEPTPARFSVQDASGAFLCPRYCYSFKEGRFYHVTDAALNFLDLPPGRYRVRATKGLDYEEANLEVEVFAGGTTDAKLVLRRQLLESKDTWYGGDHHVHLFFHKDSVHPQMTLDEVMQIARGEGLNFISFCGEWSEFIQNLGSHEIGRSEDFVGEVGLESVNDFYGHLCTMNWSKVPEQGIPMRCVPWPMNLDTIKSLQQQGGAWVNAHPFDRINPTAVAEAMGDPQRLSCARELPVILASGYGTNLDILCHAEPGGAKLITEEYYRLLNMGFKIGITASTDFYVDQGRGPPGHNRTYVRIPSLDFDSIAQAYRNGRTFATNGPLVDFQVNGCRIGDELDLPEGRHLLKARLVAFSRMGLSVAKVIVNGKVFRTAEAKGKWIDEEFEIPIEESSWVAVNVEGPVNDDVEPWDLAPDQRNLQSQFAHTSPIYIRIAGRPIKPGKQDVQFLIKWLNAARKAFHAQDNLWQGYPEEPYLASSYTKEDRQKITSAFEKRVGAAKESLLALRERDRPRR